MGQKSLLTSGVVLVAILAAILYFSKGRTPQLEEVESISVETLFETASFDPTQRHCNQFQFIEKKEGMNCTGIIQDESGPVKAALMDYKDCPEKGDLLLGKIMRLYAEGANQAEWIFHKESPEYCDTDFEAKLKEVTQKLGPVRLGMAERQLEELLQPMDTLSEGLYYLHPNLIVDIEIRDEKVFTLPRFYKTTPLECTQSPCRILSSTAIHSRRDDFILVTKLEENKQVRFDIKLCKNRRSVCQPFELKNKWHYEAFLNAFMKYRALESSSPGLTYILQRVFVDSQPVWENNQLSLSDIKILLAHFDQTVMQK